MFTHGFPMHMLFLCICYSYVTHGFPGFPVLLCFEPGLTF